MCVCVSTEDCVIEIKVSNETVSFEVLMEQKQIFPSLFACFHFPFLLSAQHNGLSHENICSQNHFFQMSL